MPRQIPAVDGRNILGIERLQCLGVIPIQKVPAITLQLPQGVESFGRAIQQAVDRDITEVIRR